MQQGGKTPDVIQSDRLSYLFHFDFDVERQCAVLTSKPSAASTLHSSQIQDCMGHHSLVSYVCNK